MFVLLVLKGLHIHGAQTLEIVEGARISGWYEEVMEIEGEEGRLVVRKKGEGRCQDERG